MLLGAFTAPVAEALGLSDLAHALHVAYLLLCPQRPEHSYWLFGAQTALEQREIAMFGAQFVAGLWYASRRADAQRLPAWLFGLLSVPMLIDIVSQSLGVRDSDWLTRTWTGGLFSLAYTLWLYPYIDEWFATRHQHTTFAAAVLVESAAPGTDEAEDLLQVR